MNDWDDVRFFLAVARGGSVRAGSEALAVNHSTVLRRLSQLESRLGAQIFDRLPSGYRLTELGREVLRYAEQMEASSRQLETHAFGRDRSVRGLLRVTLPPTLATHLLMTDFADFAQLHPEIEVEVLSIDEPVNLTNREADVAIRVVYEDTALPQNLHALKGPDVYGAIYLSRERLAGWAAGAPERLRWIVRSVHGAPDWAGEGAFALADTPFRVTDAEAQVVAARRGVGLTALPCFVGDADPLLARATGMNMRKHGTLWLLTQGETRKTTRVRLFIDFLAGRLVGHAQLLDGSLVPDA